MENVSTVSSPPKRNGAQAKPFAKSTLAVATGNATLQSLLDEVYEVLVAPEFDPQRIEDAIDTLFHGLRDLRKGSSAEQWKDMIRFGLEHPLRELIHHDPFTSRAFEKPRGYAGDAVMMDYIYGRDEDWTPPSATKLGQAIFNYTTGAPASAGVRERRCYIAELLDKVSRESKDIQVLSVAAGHLREASLSLAVRRQHFQRFVALDIDKASIGEIDRRYGRYGIRPVVANAREMLAGKLDLGTFDLIYSTGLYDYLADETAKKLTANLFQSVASGGRLVIANFLPEIRDVGYMEMYMGWHLIYRNRTDMMVLTDQVPSAQIEEIRIVTERHENIVILEMVKR